VKPRGAPCSCCE